MLQLALLQRDPVRWFSRWRERYGDLFTLRLGVLGDTVMVCDPEVAKVALTDPERLPAGEANASIEMLVGSRSTLLLDDEEHLARRRLLLPALHGEALRAFEEDIAAITRDEAARWRRGDELRMRRVTQAITLEVIVRVIFGVRDPDRVARARELLGGFVDEGANPALFFPALQRDLGPRSPWGRFVRRRRAVDAFIEGEIAARRAEPDAEDRDDVLSLLLRARDEEGRPLPDGDLRDELLTMLVAGHETTATGLAWAIEMLGRHPAVRERLVTELRDGRTEYLDAVITETLRIRPPVFDAVRRARAPVTLGGHELPAGTSVSILTTLIHRRADVYPQPDAFRPERFLDGAKPGAYAWVPFGGGVRRCLGAAFAHFEMRIVLRELLLSAPSLELVRAEPEHVVLHAVTLIPAAGVPVRVAA